MDAYTIQWRERYTRDAFMIGVAASLEAAQAFVAQKHQTRREALGEWEQSEGKWTAHVAIGKSSWDIATYEITRWPVIQPVAEQEGA